VQYRFLSKYFLFLCVCGQSFVRLNYLTFVSIFQIQEKLRSPFLSIHDPIMEYLTTPSISSRID
jgi:hypothetical protein